MIRSVLILPLSVALGLSFCSLPAHAAEAMKMDPVAKDSRIKACNECVRACRECLVGCDCPDCEKSCLACVETCRVACKALAVGK
jgi:hypothetical protein